MWRRLFLGLLVLVVGLGAVVVARTLALESAQPEVEPAPALELDARAAGRRLADGLVFETISHGGGQHDRVAFAALHEHLERSFPRAHAAFERETIGELSLLYTWRGSDPSLRPLLLMAHQDVVPVDEADWSHPPFGGEIDGEGVIWGRGAIDDKGALYGQLEAAELLLGLGFEPRRSVMFFFGHDEERGGPDGAAAAAKLFEERGIAPEIVIDEGGFVVDGGLPGLDGPVAMVGIAEKGSVTLRLHAKGPGGHSSVPPPHTLIGELAAAITRIEASPMPGGLDENGRLFLESLAPEMSFGPRLALANLWLFEPAIGLVSGHVPTMNAMMRTTTAVTMIEGGVKSNVLPAKARATINFRLRPGDTTQDVVNHVRRAVADERIEIEAGSGREASPVSPADGPAYELLQRTIREVFPGVPVIPYVLVAGTDCRQFYRVTPNVYRFNPFRFTPESITLAHGTDERVSIDALENAIRFYARFIQNGSS